MNGLNLEHAPWRNPVAKLEPSAPPKAMPTRNPVANLQPPLLPKAMPTSRLVGVQVPPPWQRHEENSRTSTKKRSASAAPAVSIREGSRAKVASASRQPHYFILQAHEVRVGDELDTDWTLSPNKIVEKHLREMRNEMIMEQLLEGKTVAYRSSGWSLYPWVQANDLCSFLPVWYEEQVNENDVVFCSVQPRGYYYAHLVMAKEWDFFNKSWKYWISNIKGKTNGWCHIQHIYGKLFQVLH